MTDATPAGWYQDPAGGGGRRYWDGSSWTEHVEAPTAWIGPPPSGPRSRTPVWVWLVAVAVVGVFVLAILVAIAVPTFLGAKERADDRAAQSSVRNAAVVVKTMWIDDAAVVTPETMHDIEPSLDFTEATSTNPQQVSVAVDAVSATVAVRSVSGKCFVIRIANPAQGGSTNTGSLPPREACYAASASSGMIPEEF
ncbi:MAG: type pilus assembly protein PilA [Actinomycetota bacterium]|jgi:type IV pilus assembly protein PilA|nr:type pilus assembly protein PilA [Actinomycetota bacterium]